MRDENGPGWILKWVTLSKRQTSTVPLTQVRRYQFHEAEACGRVRARARKGWREDGWRAGMVWLQKRGPLSRWWRTRGCDVRLLLYV